MAEKEDKKEVASVTESDKIWNEIKDLPIAMFGLNNQKVKNYVQRMKVTPKEVHLKLKVSSVIASLDPALNDKLDGSGNTTRQHKYDIEEAEGFVIIRRAAAVKLPKPENE